MAATSHTICCCGAQQDPQYPCCIAETCNLQTADACQFGGGYFLDVCPQGQGGPCTPGLLGKCACTPLQSAPPSMLVYFETPIGALPSCGSGCQKVTNDNYYAVLVAFVNTAHIIPFSTYTQTVCQALESFPMTYLNDCTGQLETHPIVQTVLVAAEARTIFESRCRIVGQISTLIQKAIIDVPPAQCGCHGSKYVNRFGNFPLCGDQPCDGGLCLFAYDVGQVGNAKMNIVW